ncbi:MAG TPA: ion channel [Rubrivivax sp.]|nr:ion channel [Rubrivivax sp.]
MAKSQPVPAVAVSPGDARGEFAAVESLDTELPLIQHMAEVMPLPDFVFGGGMLLLIVLIHATGMRMLTDRFERRIQALGRLKSTWRPDLLLGMVVSLMLLLHLFEIWVWAAALVYSGLVVNWRAAGFFAANTYTTVGYGNFLLPDGWHMLAPIIAISGLFTFGWTGSVLVEVVRRCQAAKGLALRQRQPGETEAGGGAHTPH